MQMYQVEKKKEHWSENRELFLLTKLPPTVLVSSFLL